MFARHHYLSHRLHRAARCYAATVQLPGEEPALCGFLATLINFVRHGGRRRMIHRLVILPDFQGLGLARHLLNRVAAIEAVTDIISLRTSHPALINAIARDPAWLCTDVANGTGSHAGLRRRGDGFKSTKGSFGRATVAFRFIGLHGATAEPPDKPTP